MLVVAAGNSGPTIAANPSGGTVTNLVNYVFTHGPYVQILVRLDWVNSSGAISYQFTKADVSQFIAGYSVDLRERYADFPTTGSVYWVVAPVRVNSNLQYVYPKPLEQAIATAAAIDPVNFGIEFTFPRGNLQYSEDQFGQINVSSYEELHIIRLPSSVQIPLALGIFSSTIVSWRRILSGSCVAGLPRRRVCHLERPLLPLQTLLGRACA
jgi:hypothetical protein